MLALRGFTGAAPVCILSRAASTQPVLTTENGRLSVAKRQDMDAQQIWAKRTELRKPILQRDQRVPPKVYYAPEWDLEKKRKQDDFPNPLKGYGTTPDKWEYYNKVVWPANYIVPETGLPKPREVFHCRESIHFSPKRMWQACELIRQMNVDEAITQLNIQQTKGCSILSEVLEEAKTRARDEFHIEFPSDMHVAEAFPVQSHMIKGARRHAHEVWNVIKYRYINLFVRIEEGAGPGFKKRSKPEDGWEKMESYYEHLRSRTVKYGL